MAKRANDLLDVFRLASGQGDGSAPRGRGRRKATPRARKKKAADGVFLQPRQVVLLSSTVVLLVVLAFAAGLGYGRRGSSGIALQRRSAHDANIAWWIRGKLRSKDDLTGHAIAPEAVIRELLSRYNIAEDYVRVVPEDSERLAIFLGPFSSEAKAHAYYEAQRLGTLRLRWGSPFYRAAYQQGPRSGR